MEQYIITVRCPYCYDIIPVTEFGNHVYRKHHDISMPLEVTKEYLDNRFGYTTLDYFASLAADD